MSNKAISNNAHFWSQWRPDDGRAVEHEVWRIERAWDRAVRSCDVASLIEMMADDYVVTNTSGDTADKSKILKLLAASGPTRTSMNRDITEVRVYGDTAVVIGHITWRARASEPRPNGHSTGREARYVKVYVKGPNGWQAVITQTTRIEDESGSHHMLLH